MTKNTSLMIFIFSGTCEVVEGMSSSVYITDDMITGLPSILGNPVTGIRPTGMEGWQVSESVA